ncbi:50S ribosomal protein L18 [bacterium]|nr:50S ribosomal protein L18 [bacterium]
MKHPKKVKMDPREKRAHRIRRKIQGTPERPRLAIFRSLTNIYVQLIDDTKGVSLLGVSTKSPEMKGQTVTGGKTGYAKAVGKLVAEKAKEKGIINIVFDRSGYLYHGRIKAVADGAREGGLNF